MSSTSGLTGLTGPFIKVSSPESHVALVEVSRKPVNAFNERCWTELGQVFDKLSCEPEVRAVVLASALPKLFSAGIDLSSLADLERRLHSDPDRRALQLRDNVTSMQKSISAIEHCPYPVIAATHGVAYGLSIDIFCACDVRYAASDSRFSIKEVDVGLAADIGTLARLPKIAGNHSLVRELAYTSRDFSAIEAEKMGFISRVVEGGRDEVLAAALETARTIAEKSPIAIAGTKHLLLHSRDHTVQDNLDYTATWNGIMLQSSDIREISESIKTKRKPEFVALRKLPSKL